MASTRILIVMGVSGSGKSTVAALLAGRLGWALVEGDDLHPAANIEKMAHGIPLDDATGYPGWLPSASASTNGVKRARAGSLPVPP